MKLSYMMGMAAWRRVQTRNRRRPVPCRADPLAHPAVQAMSLRDLADLPIEHPCDCPATDEPARR